MVAKAWLFLHSLPPSIRELLFLSHYLVVQVLHVLHEVVVGGGVPAVHDPVQVGEVAVQVNVVGVRAADQEVGGALGKRRKLK